MNDIQVIEKTQPLQTQASASALAVQQRQMAEIEAAVVVAQRIGRNVPAVTGAILAECKKTSLAEVSSYSYPKGGARIEGPSIRMAECIKQLWGHIRSGLREIGHWTDDEGVGVTEVEAWAWDVLANNFESVTFTVKHERVTKKGRYPLTDPREVRELKLNYGKRQERACILALIPEDIKEKAMEACKQTLLSTTGEALETRIAKMIAEFKEQGVTQKMIEARIQHNIDSITPQELIGLGKIFVSIRDGYSVVTDWFEQVAENQIEEKLADEPKPEPKKKAPAKKTAPKKTDDEAPSATQDVPEVYMGHWDRITRAKEKSGNEGAKAEFAELPAKVQNDLQRQFFAFLKESPEAS